MTPISDQMVYAVDADLTYGRQAASVAYGVSDWNAA